MDFFTRRTYTDHVQPGFVLEFDGQRHGKLYLHEYCMYTIGSRKMSKRFCLITFDLRANFDRSLESIITNSGEDVQLDSI